MTGKVFFLLPSSEKEKTRKNVSFQKRFGKKEKENRESNECAECVLLVVLVPSGAGQQCSDSITANESFTAPTTLVCYLILAFEKCNYTVLLQSEAAAPSLKFAVISNNFCHSLISVASTGSGLRLDYSGRTLIY